MLTVYRVAVMSTEAASGSTNPAYDQQAHVQRVMSAIPSPSLRVAQSGASIGMSKVSRYAEHEEQTSAPTM